MWKTWVQSLGWKDPLKKGKATHSSILAWRIPCGLYSPWGRKELDRGSNFHFTSGLQVRACGGLAAVAQSGDKLTFCSCLKRMRVAPPNEGVQTIEGHLGSERTGGKRTGQRRGLSCRLLVGPVLGLAPASLWIGGRGAKAGRSSGNGATRPAKLLLENPANVFRLGQDVRFRGPGKAKQPGEVYRTFSDPRSLPKSAHSAAFGTTRRQSPDGWLLPLGLGFPRCEMRGECPSSKATPVCGDPGR